jgi:hypothetical protein
VFLLTPVRRVAELARGLLERGDDVGASVGEAGVDRRRQPREDIDDGQDANLSAIEELVMNEIHRPDLVGRGRQETVLAELGLDPSLG